VKLFVEGGGDHNKPLQTACRKAFSMFVTRAGITNRPRIVACGGRTEAYQDFRVALENPNQKYAPMLLVDSETAVVFKSKWDHLRRRQGDGWQRPANAGENDVFLMVQCMESWLLADPTRLADYFGQGFRKVALPKNSEIETVPKETVFKGILSATRGSRKGTYDKGNHSFGVLEKVDPSLVTEASPYAKQFINELKRRLQ
jgi:hypothetical protein